MYVMIIGAHPDDAEFSTGGTMIRFRRRGDIVKAVSVTNGNRGHFADEYRSDPSRLARRRIAEAKRAAEMIGAEFDTLDVNDGEVYVTKELTEKIVRVIRSFGPEGEGPDLVIVNRPVDYHRDHRYTSQLVLDATYMLTVPLFCPDTPHLKRMPVFAYWWDRFEEIKPFRPDVVVPIDDVIEQKIDMVMAHESQVFEWLPYNAGRLDEVPDDPEARRDFLARGIRSRGERVRNSCLKRIKELFGDREIKYAEAFQISQYGRQPDEEELKGMFPI
jgi:LmbE family N-acetylglucosaminyl deacetylase